MNEKIFNLYNSIFDKNGNVTACGREKCKQLINALQEEYPDVVFGDKETGFLNVETINKYIKTN